MFASERSRNAIRPQPLGLGAVQATLGEALFKVPTDSF